MTQYFSDTATRFCDFRLSCAARFTVQSIADCCTDSSRSVLFRKTNRKWRMVEFREPKNKTARKVAKRHICANKALIMRGISQSLDSILSMRLSLSEILTNTLKIHKNREIQLRFHQDNFEVSIQS